MQSILVKGVRELARRAARHIFDYAYIYILELTREITMGERMTRECSCKRLLNKGERARIKRELMSQVSDVREHKQRTSMQASQHTFRQQLIEYPPHRAQLLAKSQPVKHTAKETLCARKGALSSNQSNGHSSKQTSKQTLNKSCNEAYQELSIELRPCGEKNQTNE